jgi:pimeloyl-ACP methyl ester carboxylesterase
MNRSLFLTAAAVLTAFTVDSHAAEPPKTVHKTVSVDGLDIFYREAGPKDAPVVLLLHGFPTSSQMYRNLIPKLADTYRVIAPDYPGFGQSAMPARESFPYTFDNLAALMEKFTKKLELNTYALYVQDYGAPIGYRLASMHPERVTAIVVQNGNADIQLDLFLSYGSNPPLYPKWQAYFRKHQPPVLIVWGRYDTIFPPAGAEPYKRDLKNVEFHLLDAGHFALETHGDEIAGLMRTFLDRVAK